jgi:hypothetical protein
MPAHGEVMTMRLPQGLAAGADKGHKGVFRVVMAYDDFTSGKRAMDACHFLGFQLGGGVELRSSMWKFDILRNARLNEIAVADAIEADVIIVANAPDAGLPEEVARWVEAWVPRKRGQTAALVALLDFTGKDPRESAQAYALLKGAAASASIDFLPQEIRGPDNAMAAFPPVPLKKVPRARADAVTSRPPPEGWGLND